MDHKRISLSASTLVVNKLPKVLDTDAPEEKEVKRKRWSAFNRSFNNAEFTVEELCEHIQSGYAISAELTEPHRTGANFKSSQILGADFDTEDSRSSIESLLRVPFIRDNALLVHTTASHTPEKPRARVLFLLDRKVVSGEKYSEYQRALLAKLKQSDQQVNDPARLWFGARGCRVEMVGKTLQLQELVKRAKGEEAEAEQFVQFGQPIPEGTRNNHAYHYALEFLRAGLGEDKVLELLVENWRRLGYQAPVDELTYAVQSAAKKAKDSRGRSVEPLLKNDDDNARKLISEYGDVIIYVTGVGWFVWTGRSWEFDADDARLRVMASNTMRRIRDEALEDAKDRRLFRDAMARATWAVQSMNVGRLNAMIDQASKYPEVRRTIDQIDSIEGTKFLLNFMNGTLDLETGELMPHDKDQLITKLIPHNYTIESECPTWLRTLELAFNGNPRLIEFMKRSLGYTVSGSVREKCLFICHGEHGDNAKSTIFEAVRYALGRDYTIMSSVDVITNRDNSNYVLASLAQMAGIRMVHMNEAEQNQAFSEALVKQMTGGDLIQTKKMRMDPVEFLPVFKLWIRANGLPRIKGTDNAIWNRIKLIPFETIPKELQRSRDEIDELLHQEAEGILAWMVEGFMAWRKSGLGSPSEVTRAVEDYRSENDWVQQFVDEHIVRSASASMSTADVYSAFIRYMELSGNRRHGINQQNFSKRLKTLLGVETRKSHGRVMLEGVGMSEDSRVELGVL